MTNEIITEAEQDACDEARIRLKLPPNAPVAFRRTGERRLPREGDFFISEQNKSGAVTLSYIDFTEEVRDIVVPIDPNAKQAAQEAKAIMLLQRIAERMGPDTEKIMQSGESASTDYVLPPELWVDIKTATGWQPKPPSPFEVEHSYRAPHYYALHVQATDKLDGPGLRVWGGSGLNSGVMDLAAVQRLHADLGAWLANQPARKV